MCLFLLNKLLPKCSSAKRQQNASWVLFSDSAAKLKWIFQRWMFGCHHQIPTASFKRVPSEQRGSLCERGTKDRHSERLFAGGGEFNNLSKLCRPPALTACLRLSRRLGEADAPAKAIRQQLAPTTRRFYTCHRPRWPLVPSAARPLLQNGAMKW